MAKVAIDGFGRIGRATFKVIRDVPELDLVAINDIAPVENLAYLLNDDTAYGRYKARVEAENGILVVGGEAYEFLQAKDPT